LIENNISELQRRV